MAPILLNVFSRHQTPFFLFLTFLLFLGIWYVHVFLFDIPFPSHLEHLRKGTLIWKELHYRLALFVIAIFAYGLTETTFNLWGFVQLDALFGTVIANETMPIFWLFLIIGQILLLVPLYFFPAKRIFYFLIFTIFAAALYFSYQQHLSGFIIGLVLAGFGCSAVLPILLSMMEKEILAFAPPSHLVPYIETVVSVLMGAYFTGMGVIDLWVDKWGHNPLFPIPLHFQLAAIYIAVMGLLSLFLNLTVPKKS